MSSILGPLEGGVIGVAVGEGAAAAIEPSVEPAKQAVWEKNPYRVLEPELLAELVAQALVRYDDAQPQAQRSGYDGNKFRAMVEATFKAPGTPEALELWRRGRIGPEQMRHALHKAGLEAQYVEPIMELFGERLAPSDVANAIQQGFLANDGVLPAATPPDPNWTPSAGPVDVPVEQVALSDADQRPVTTTAEAKASGIDLARLRVLAELAGLPPGEETLLDMWRRGMIDATTYAHGLREGHTKTKWTRALSARFYQLLPAGVLVRLRLKGWIEDPEYKARMHLHGYRPDAAEDWYLSEGRPAAPQQMATAVARAVDGPDGVPMNEAQFVKGIRESDIRPEWAAMLWGIRFAYPPLFQVNRLVQAGAIDPDTGAEWMHKNRSAPEVVAALHRYWTSATTATTVAPEVKSAHTRALTLLRNAYVARRVDDAFAIDRLTALGIDAAVQGPLLDAWRIMQTIPGAGLTRAQVKRAFRSLPAEWPRDRALTELEDLGMEPDEAATYLDE